MKNLPRVLLLMLCCCYQATALAAATCNSSIPESTPTADFDLSATDGTAVHISTGLIWSRCLLGQTWNNATSNCDGSITTGNNWQTALTAADGSTLAGFSDWRLPNIKELNSIVERQCVSPAINEQVFPVTSASFHWSASGVAGNPNVAWGVDFSGGHDFIKLKDGARRVRLVRGGQLFDTFDKAVNLSTVSIDSTSPNPATVGSSVSINFTVTGATPTGTVRVNAGNDSCSGTVTSGSCNITFASAGSKTLVADYLGDGNNNPSSSAAFDIVVIEPVVPTPTTPSPAEEEEPLKTISETDTSGQLSVIDLNTDIVADSALIDDILDSTGLTAIANTAVVYTLDSETGLLHGQWNGQNTTLRPVSVTEAEGEAVGISFTEDGQVQMITEKGRKIIFQVEVQAFEAFTSLLGQFGLQIERDAENNLKIFNSNNSGNPETDSWFNVRPALLSEAVNDETETAGIKTYQYPDLPSVTGYYYQFIKDGQLYRQLMHAMPTDWSKLKILLNSFPGAEAVSIGADGLIFVLINGTDYFGRVDARVNPVEINQVLLDVAYLFNREDVNGDGRDDYQIIYPSGVWQRLYLLN